MLLVFAFLSTINVTPSFAGRGVADFLCERGIYFYENGDYVNAWREFKKALLVEPEHEVALEYIDLIKESVLPREEEEEVAEEEVELAEEEEELERERKKAIMRALEEAEIEPFLVEEVEEEVEEEIIVEAEEEIAAEEVLPLPPRKREPVVKKRPLERLILDEEVQVTQPDTAIEIEMKRPLLIEGEQIKRFLVTLPEMLDVERKTADTIELKAIKLGSSFLHIWDNQGRWTFKVQNIPAQPVGPTLEEVRRREIEKAENFKLHYSFYRDAYYLGTKPSNLERETLSFDQWVGADGETPYGKFDSSARIAKLRETTDLTYLTLGLTQAHLGALEDFDLRLFDYNIYGSELVFPGTNLRGVRFDQRFSSPESNYTLFWGREGRGTFGRLSPGLAEAEDSFLEGVRYFLKPSDNFDYQLAYYHGYGDEREATLREDSVDIVANLDYEKWKGSVQAGYDTVKFAYLLDSVFLLPGLRIRTEYRNISPEYVTIIDRPSRIGEMGGLGLIEFSGIDDLFLSQRVDIYQDRLYPNPELPEMWNVELDSYANYRLSENTALNANFRYWDEKGKISPRRERSIGGGISQKIDLLKKKDLLVYSNYRYQQTKNFNSITSDYEKHRVITGLRLNLFDGFSTFASQEYNWLEEVSPEQSSQPRAWEAGIDYNQQIGKLPLYGSLRAYYRDEKDTASTYSFLAGEDSFEVQGQLSYRPFADWEIFVDGRLRKVWPEDLEARSIYTEGEFITGVRLLFDTGLTWNPVGDIYGKVFKDINGDGLRDEDEPGIEGVKIFLGKEQFSVSDAEGRFSFLKIRAKNAYLNLDLSSVPAGFVPSTATLQEVSIKHGDISTANFGLTFRSEIIGSVFVDANGNGQFDAEEEGLANVVLRLEDGTQARTNNRGQFYFRKVLVGKHTLFLDVNTVPIHFLPKVPIKKELSLSEGMSYIYNIPLEPLE